MGLWKLLLSCVFISMCSADPTFTATNSMLDPNRLFWWRTKWASAPILLSVNNAGQSSTATFYFSPTTTLTNGVFEVTFPTGFTVGSGGTGQSRVGQVVQYTPVTYLGGQDYQVTISGLTNPAMSGAYGPFALRTRYSANSQQVDVNLAFGSVWIYPTAGTLGSFTVSLAGTTINNVINKSGNTLSYKFTLGVSLWRYDTFILGIDPKWTVASGASCASADYAGRWNNFNGTNSASPHQLDCVVTTASVYIYGLAVDGIDLTATTDNAYVDLRVSSVMTPNAVYTGNPYSWSASTSRFGTTTILETATYTSGPGVITDVISSAAWTPTWGLTNSAIATGTIYFMDLSFTITNAIPTNGKITITVTENLVTGIDTTTWVPAAAGGAASNCYIVTYLSTLSSTVSYAPNCGIVTNTITLTGLPALTAGTPIKVRNLVSFTAGAGGTEQITSLLTFDGSNNAIDANTLNLGTFTLATNTAAITTFTTSFVSNAATSVLTVNQAGNTSATQAIIFSLVLSGTPAFTPSTAVTITCPFTSDLEDFSITIPASTASFQYTATVATVTSLNPLTSNIPTLTTTGSYSTPGNIAFTGSLGQSGTVTIPSFTTNLNLMLFSIVSTYISLPRVANNLATAYECRIMFTTASTGSTVPSYSAGSRFVIAAQGWSTSSFSSPCTSYIDGIPAIFSLQPTLLGVPQSSNSGATYYVEFGFSGVTANTIFGASSGLTYTAVTTQNYQASLNSVYTTAYPVQSSQSGAIAAVTYVASSVNYVAVTGLKIAGFVSGATAAPVTVTFPIGGYATSAAVTPTISTYYILAADPRYKFITHSASAATFTYAATALSAVTAFGGTPVISLSNTSINGQSASTALALGLYSAAGTYTAPYYIFFILGKGWTWSSSKSITSSTTPTTAYTNSYFFTLTNAYTSTFGYAGALLYVSTTSPLLNGFLSTAAPTPATATITLSGFTLPLGVASPTVTLGVTGTGTSVCNNYASISYTATVGAINSLTVSPSAIKTSGPDGVNVSHTVSFSLTHGIPAGGSISLTFNNAWVTPALSNSCTYCTVTGVSSLTTNGVTTAPVCTISTNIVTVTGFADFSSTTSSTAITIGIYGLIAPSTVSTSPGTQFVNALATYVSATATPLVMIDQAATFTGTLVTITVSTTSGVTTWTTKKTYPMSAGTNAVDLYLKFSLPHSLPKCGVITISSPLAFLYSNGLVNNVSFLSPVQYTSSVMTTSGLQITLGQTYTGGSVLELYLDNAVNNPASTTTSSTGFAINSSWGGVTVDADTGSITSSQTFTASMLLSSAISAANAVGVSFVPTTTGEAATYTFDFKDTVAYALGDQYWIVFPPQFDYFLGNNWIWLTNESNSYYSTCSSTQLGNTWCTVNHNIVVVWGSSAVTSGTEIVININGVTNPPPVQTSAFQIYHVNSSGTYLTVSQTFGTVTPTAFPTNLYVRSLVQTDNRLFQVASYTWRLYVIDTMYLDSQLQVLFPREFDLNKFDKKVSYSCASTWLDNSLTANIKSQQNWNSASTCAASGNLVTLPAPSMITTFTSTSVVTWNIQSVVNTQWGQPRSAQNVTTDFDVQDATLWPIYPYWVSKFTFFVYRTSAANLLYTSRSYPNTNAAYAGFIDGYRPLYVNNYSPQSKASRIVVYAGTQTTDIYISTTSATQPCSAKQIVLTPTTNSRTPDNGKLTYTSVTNNWILFQAYWQIQFRVAADIGLSKGLYYIDWTNSETKQTGVNDVQYDTPASTLVEVVAASPNYFAFGVASIPIISTGSTSLPIKISISNAPHADATINISVTGSPANISITPTSLTFGPDVNALYFQVSVGSNYDMTLGNVQPLVFSITGTDAAVYSITSSVKFTITQASSTVVAGNVVSWGLGTPTKTMETAAPSTDQVGVIYYQLSAAGTIVPSFSTLKASMSSLVNANSTSSSTGSTSTSPTSSTQSDPLSGESWTQFQYRLYKNHLQMVWVGSIVMLTTTASTTITFNWLYAATQYQLSGYLDNLSPSTSPLVHTEYFTTTAIAAPQPFTIVFVGNVASSFATKIAQEAANVQGINPLRLGTAAYSQGTTRRLVSTSITSSTFAYTLVPNRFSEGPDPSAQAQITGTALTTFTKNLVTDGITSALTGVTNSAVPVRTVPSWSTVPTSAGSTSNSISLVLRSNTAGLTCCVALTSSVTQPTPEQVMLGLNTMNNATSYTCTNTDLTQNTNNVTIANLVAGTSYYAFCSATDNYPLWPTQMSYSTTTFMSYVAVSTLASGNTTIVTSASYFGGLALLLALLFQ